jgi:hypothetical protein
MHSKQSAGASCLEIIIEWVIPGKNADRTEKDSLLQCLELSLGNPHYGQVVIFNYMVHMFRSEARTIQSRSHFNECNSPCCCIPVSIKKLL